MKISFQFLNKIPLCQKYGAQEMQQLKTKTCVFPTIPKDI
jgi:hypothetical protein